MVRRRQSGRRTKSSRTSQQPGRLASCSTRSTRTRPATAPAAGTSSWARRAIADHSTVTLQNTIVSNGIVGTSPTTNCSAVAGATIASAGYNLIDDSTCGTPAGTDIIGQSPQLGALANNGGPTQTELPAHKSPAVGAIPDAVWVATGVAADQRGIARGAGPASSATIGAVEVGRQLQRLPPGRQRGRDLRLRARLQRVAGQQPPQRPHRGHRQFAGAQRLPDGGR